MSDEKKIVPNRSEQEFDDFLREGDSRYAALYRKLPQPEPDAHLDARVHALAQHALREPASAIAAVQAPPRWRVNPLPAFGAAAVLVLAAGLAWRVAPRIWPPNPPAPTASAPLAMQSTQPAAAPASATAVVPGSGNAPASPADAFPAQSSITPQPAARQAQSAAPSAPVTSLSRSESPGLATAPRSKPAAARGEAFPTATAPLSEPARDNLGKVENAASAAVATAPAPLAPAAKAARSDEREKEREAGDRIAGQRNALDDRAAKTALATPEPAIARGAPQPGCPAALGAQDWHGTYPPEIPPDPDLRFAYVGDLLRQGQRDSARKAYAEFHKRCPGDHWPQAQLDQLGLQ